MFLSSFPLSQTKITTRKDREANAIFWQKKKKEAVIIKVNIYLGLILHQFSKDFVLTHICASKQY